MSLLSELQRRNVIRMGGLYLVGAWLVTQVAGTVFPMFGAPDWVARSVVLVLAIGFIPTLIVSWVFELTPDGLKRDGDVEITKSIAPQTARRMDRMLLVVMALALGYFAVDKFVLAPSRLASSATQLVTPASTDASAAAPTAQPAQAPVESKSIAVLAFADLSQSKDQEYFSDGVAEEILNALAKVDDLKVAGRTSSFYFKGRNESLVTIGSTLGVAHVLEGSVRKQGDRLRISAKLLRISDGVEMWAETFDGTDADIFALQENIAQQVTTQLKVALNAGEQGQLVDAGTENPQAYSLYLQATSIFNRRDVAHYADAIAALEQATRLDPNFALAYSRLAALYVLLATSSEESLRFLQDKVAANARQASVLDPTLAEPYAALGVALSWVPGGLVAQRQSFARALALDGDDVTTIFWYGLTLQRTGYRERGTTLIDRALEMDPMLPNALRWRGILYFHAGDTANAELLLKRSRDLGLKWADGELAYIANARGDTGAAIQLSASGLATQLPGMPPGSNVVLAEGIYGDSDARARALALIDDFVSKSDQPLPGMITVILFLLGEPAEALTVQRKRQDRDPTDFLALLWSPQGKVMRELPEFQPFLRDFGLIELWDQYGPPDLCKKNDKGDYVCE